MRPNKNKAILFLTLIAMLLGSIALSTGIGARKMLYDGSELANMARPYVGTPYQYGGNSPSGFDCSGLTSFVYKKAGYVLPRSASAQYRKMNPVKVPRRGDLVFFKTSGSRVSHVGIYMGNFRFLHAPSSGKKVRYDDMRSKYWKRHYAGARTIFKYRDSEDKALARN